MTRRRHRLAGAGIAFAIVTTLVTVLPEVAVAAPEAEFTPRAEKSVPVKNVPPAPTGPDAAEEKALKGSPAVKWPTPAVTDVPLGTQQRAASPGPIQVSRKDTAARAKAGDNTTIRVEVLPKRLDGPAFRLSGAEHEELSVAVDYSGFRDAFGGDWANRLKLAILPDCALTTPDSLDCQPKNLSTRNDGSGTLTADVKPGPNQLFAVTATASSGSGDYNASSMSPGSTWSAGASSGDFSWEYDMDAPPSLEGPEPDLQLSYSSGNVDARTSATNNQPGWAGEGFDFNPGGYIERRYTSCSSDTKDSNNTKKTGDLCWRTENATLQLNGSGGEMVRDDVSGTWKLRGDDGSKIEKLSGKDNGDNNGEAWKITTRDGTQYFFGLNKLPGWATGKQTTNSAWTAPVFGNHSGEDCYKAGSFDTSWCQQAWRWNLDYVVDPHGNTMSYFYKTETNNYSRNLTATKVSNYVRDGYIDRIDYGQRDGEVYTKPAIGQVVFTVADRCIPGTQCVTTQPQNWPDTPLDQLCTSTTNCGNKYTPSFWTQKRLAKVTTKVWNGTAFKNVDEWTLTHSYPAPGDGTRAGMWLDSIQRTGLVGGSMTLPATTFEGIQLSNRVDGIEGIPPMNWWRLKAIRTETGAELAVNYLPKECSAPGALPAEDSNTKRCHPLKWTPDSLDDLAKERMDWFHKYVVSDVTEKDLTTGLAPEVTKINYVGQPAWHHDEEDGLVPAERKSWSQWRGYDRVQTLKGQQGGEQEQTEVLYFRGMDEDKTAAGAVKDVKVVDSNGVAVDDSNQLAGSEREVITYDKAGGKVISREITDQWVSAPTATRVRSWGTTKSYKVGESAVRRAEVKPDGSALKSGSNNTFDAGGLVTRTEDLHNLDDPNDDTCTRYTYAHNAATHMMDAEVQEETVRVSCDKTPNLPADLVGVERTYYDNSDTFGAAPVKGDPTRRDVFNGWVNGAPVFKTLGRAKFDIYGRAVEATDVAGKTSTTTYESTVGGPVTKVTTTNPLGQKSSTEYETAWGEPVAITDTNNKRTEKLHDPLGRVVKSWLPGRDRSQSPSTEHSYLIRTNGANVVTNKTLQPNGEYTTEIELYDGQMRERQSQEPAPGGGRVIKDTIYDSRGLEVKSNGPFYNDAPPGTDVVTPDEAMLPTQRVFEYDGEGRLKAEILKVEGTEKWRTTHSYDGRQYSVDPPDGDTPTTKITDAEGKLVELRQYKGNAPTGDYDKTTYTYTPHGQLETVTDPAGNVWRHEYDMLGREIKVSDPDRGVTDITYNDYDQVATKKDATGRVLAFAYDDIGRNTAVHEGSLTGPKLVEWGFDKLPDGTSVPGVATSSTRYLNGNAYTQAITGVDSGNRPTGMSITIPASEGKLAGTYKFATNYKTDGDIADTTLPAVAGLAEEKLTFGYNSLGLPTTLSGQTSYVTNTSYTPYSEPQTVTLSAGGKWVKRSAEYEIGTRRVQRTITERETPGRVVSNVSYTYDAAGNITRIHNQPGADTGEVADTQCFQHDYLRRMTGAWTPRDGNCAAAPSSAGLGGAAPYWHGWTYDKAGNRTSETKVTPDGKTTSSVYTYPAAGQAKPHAVQKVTTTGPSGTKVDEFGYDATGNTTSRKLGTAPGQTLEWDAEGLLAKVTEGSKVTSYVYDADGNRLLRRDTTGVTLYLGATEVLLTPAGALQATRSYVHDNETVAIRTSNGKLHWLDSNHVGTAEVSIDADTQEVSRRRTDPFGGARGAQPTTWPSQKGFVGGTIDGDTGLTQLGERAYDTATGRFISADPEIDYTEPQQLNAFAYANNNPVTFSDPDGRYFVVVLIPIAVRILVPILVRIMVPVLRRVFVWVAKQVVRFIGWLLKKLVSTKWVQVAKTVTVMVGKWIVRWVAKTITRIKKSKVWKEAKKKIAKAIGKKNVERLKKAREKVRKWVSKWKSKKKKGPAKPKEQKKEPRKKQPKKKKEPTPELYALGNASGGPQIKETRTNDYERVGDEVLSQEGKDLEDLKGLSTYDTPEHLEARLSTAGSHLYRLPKGYNLPEGLDWVFDNNPPGHHTIYATRNMSFEEYKAKIASLEWEHVKQYPKKKKSR